jgi:hypothetical protein
MRNDSDLRKDFNFLINAARTGDTVQKFGRIAAAGVTAEDIWDGGGLYPFQTSAQSIEAVSDDADDDKDAGTGARTIIVEGLDANWALQSETVELEGLTAVDLQNTYIRIFRAYVVMAGSQGVNDGNISIQIDGGGTVLAQITAEMGQTLMAVYTVPLGFTAFVLHYYADLTSGHPTGAEADIALFVRPDASAATAPLQLKHLIGLASGGTSHHMHNFGAPLVVEEKSDIILRALSTSDADTPISGGFGLFLLKDD